jgi:uncharacterized protein (TIGR02145 family)
VILMRNVDFMSKQFRVMVLVAGLFIVLGSCEEPVSPAYNNPYDPGSRNFTPSPTLQTNAATQITGTTAVSGGTVGGVSAYNVTAKGVCVSLQPNPPLGSNCTNQGAGVESFTSNLTGLSPGTRYYIRAYVTIVTGTTTFGQQLEFFTTTATPPTLSTSAVSSITANSAVGGGNVTSAGSATVTARGICWSTSQNPTTSNSCVSSGSGTGSFTANMTGLSAGTLYYVRAYATSSAGTSYGSQVQFTTTAASTSGRDTQTAVVNVSNPTTGRTWMDRNLGASRAATSSTDTQAYGDLYQWGRRADGHEKPNSGTTSTLSSTDQPAHGSFILAPNSPFNWRSPQNDNLWQGVNGTNNPCPVGYRIPTEAEWTAERNTWSSQNATGAFASPLKLPLPGFRDNSSGSLFNVGSHGIYWSSSVSGTDARYLVFLSSNAGMNSFYRARGYSVRCIRD